MFEKIKRQLKRFKNWIKKKWKALLIILPFAISAVMASSYTPAELNRLNKVNAINDNININGIEKQVFFTDNNDGENFIIKSDNKDYYTLGGGVVAYFSITNVSEINQDAFITILLGEKQLVNNIKRFAGNSTVYDTIPATATTSEYQIAREVTEWETMKFDNGFNIKKIALIRKDVKNRKINKVFKDNFQSGETKYYRMSMQVPLDITENEWFIEVFGKDYGHLDPNLWIYEQKFNALNDGDLNGQDSWSGSAAIDVSTDAAARYEGAKGVKTAGAVGDEKIVCSITGIESGTMYVSVKNTVSTTGYPYYILWSGASQEIWIALGTDGKIKYLHHTNGWTQIGSETFVVDTWYRIGIRFRTTGAAAYEGLAEGKMKVNVDNGAWNGPYDFYTNTGNNIDKFDIHTYCPANHYVYFDYLSYEYEEAAVDPCEYSGTGNWDVLYSDNCYVTSETYVLGDFNLIYDAAGSFNLQATLKCDDMNVGAGATISAENATAQIEIY